MVDRAEMQHKIHEEEPDIVWIMGWCYVPGEDNALYDKKMLLRRRTAPAMWQCLRTGIVRMWWRACGERNISNWQDSYCGF